jgi:hypothetical protein
MRAQISQGFESPYGRNGIWCLLTMTFSTETSAWARSGERWPASIKMEPHAVLSYEELVNRLPKLFEEAKPAPRKACRLRMPNQHSKQPRIADIELVRAARWLALLSSVVVCAQTAVSQDAADICERVGETDANLKSYDFEGEGRMTAEAGGAQYRTTVSIGLAATAPTCRCQSSIGSRSRMCLPARGFFAWPSTLTVGRGTSGKCKHVGFLSEPDGRLGLRKARILAMSR